MIATILPGSTSFHAVGYNEHKVAKGTAQLLLMQNFGSIGRFNKHTPQELIAYLQTYTSRNSRIKKAQFHLAISCKGHEKTEEELVEFAHQYLKEMGYGEPGQPLLIYAHRDTPNTHIHIITSRIAPDGHKINHNNERRRSQQAIDKILGRNASQEAAKDIEAAKDYVFSSLPQFRAILSSMGYESYQKNDRFYYKKGGMVKGYIQVEDIFSQMQNTKVDKGRIKQLRAILLKYRDLSNSKTELQNELKKKFGIDLVFYGKKDSPYGYSIVDHKNKQVINGSSVLGVKRLLEFTSPGEKLDNLDSYIAQLLKENPKLTTHDIYTKLYRVDAYFKQGKVLCYGTHERPLSKENAEALNRNDRIHIAESFRPCSIFERDALAAIFKIKYSADMIELSADEPSQSKDSAINEINELFLQHSGAALRAELRNRGYSIRRDGDRMYCINYTSKTIIDLQQHNLDVSRLWRNSGNSLQKNQTSRNTSQRQTEISKISSHGIGGGASHGVNREWEVGDYDGYDKIDGINNNGLKH